MADPIVHITSGLPDSGTGNITTLGMTINAIASATAGQSGPLVMGAVTTAAPTYTTAQTNPLSLTTAGLLRVDGSGATQPVSGTVAATQSGTWTVQPGNTANTTAWLVTGTGGTFPVTGTFWQATQPVSIAATVNTNATQSGTWTVQRIQNANSTGLTQTRVVAAATTNATSLKASAGNIAAIDLFNVAAYMVFLKLYNKASAPTVGTDTPVWTIPIPASGGFSIDFSQGEYFSTGIAFAITKLQADSDTTVLVAGDVTGRIKWV